MTWWWDNLIDLEPLLYYPMFGAGARFVSGVRFDRERFEPMTGTTEGGRRRSPCPPSRAMSPPAAALR